MKLLTLVVPFIFCIHSPSYAQNTDGYLYLDQLALEANADKASNFHNYTEVYCKYFNPIKEMPIKFLEIGIWKGFSVKLWENYFKNAELHFMDITLNNVIYKSDRSYYHLIDQANADALEGFIQLFGGGFDVILDDGGHTMQQQIVSFQTLFPHVNSGGIYIIEDLHTSYWPEYGGGSHDRTTIAFLKNLIDEVNYVGNHTERANHRNLSQSVLDKLNLYQKQIESIHFYDSTAIIIKR
jgi:hypothetical protein